MKRLNKAIVVLFLFAIFFIGCDADSGSSFFNLPEQPQEIFRAGYGKITIRYEPPPDPIFRVQAATQYIDLRDITASYRIPDRPLILELQVDMTVRNISVIAGTEYADLDRYIARICEGWTYTTWGRGYLRMSVNIRAEEIVVDASSIILETAPPDRAPTRVGNPQEMIRASNFRVVRGDIRR